jgi:hypothetical protein
LLAGKYKRKSAKHLTKFEDATKEQKLIFHPINIPQKCIQEYNTASKTSGGILVSLKKTF